MRSRMHYANTILKPKPTHEELEQQYQEYIAAGGKVTQGPPPPEQYPAPHPPHRVSKATGKKKRKVRSKDDPMCGIFPCHNKWQVYQKKCFVGMADTVEEAIEMKQQWIKENVDKN